MKLDARQTTAFLRDPGSTRLVLLYGDDEGLLRERALTLTRHVAGSPGDPFLVVELAREGWGRIPAEMAALSMIGGRRVVVVRDATDAILPQVAEALRGPGEALLILEAPALGKGRLRSLAEAAPDGVAIACYPEEGRAVGALIAGLLSEARTTSDPDVIDWLSARLGGDRGVVRGELDKLVLLVGPGGHVTIEAARACIGDMGESAGNDGLLAASLGDIAACDRAVEAALADGLNGVALLRMALGHLQKLHQARLRMQGGLSAAEAVRMMRPPVFYKAATSMGNALAAWSAEALLGAIEEARRVELACKQTGSRPDLLARRFVAGFARAGWVRRGRLG